MFKRIALFVLTNFLIIATISVIMNVLGVQPYLTASGINYQALMIFCLIWGMVGSFISLALSRIMAKWMMGVKLVDPQRPEEYAWLVNKTHDLARRANLPAMPQVGVYQSPEVNAFATGPTKSRSLVAVSTGLMQRMNNDEIEGVLAHEIAHIQNGDMVTMTLLQGVVNAFVMFFARVIGYAASQWVKDDARHLVQMLVTIAFDIILGLLGMMVVARFSRYREFRADAGGAALAGRERMRGALESLSRFVGQPVPEGQPASVQAFKISSGRNAGWKMLFSTHPPLEERIARLSKL